MTESADLARLVASQLGGDLDRILGSLPSSEQPTEPEVSTKNTASTSGRQVHEPLELCQIAGLGAGQRVVLTPGTYDIGPRTSPPGMPGCTDVRMVPFRLHVGPDNAVTLTTLTHPVSVDGRQISDGLRMRGGYIDAFAARFSLGPPASVSQPVPSAAQIASVLPPKKIPVSEIRGVSIEHKSRRRNKRNRDAEDFPELTKAVLESRARDIRRQRMISPDACELLRRAKTGRSHIWKTGRSDSEFGVATLAYGETPWTPPYDRPDKIRDEAAYAVHQFLELPSVPVTLDLKSNGLGIVGPRDSALAVARHIAISLCISSGPSDLMIAVMAGAETSQDWAWIGNLPHAQSEAADAMPVLLIDGLAQIGAGELRSLLAEKTNLGAVVIESELGDLPSICGTVMELRADGSAAVMDFRRGKTINSRATPVGMSVPTSVQAVKMIRAALTPIITAASNSISRDSLPQIAVPDHIKRPDSPTALPQRKR